MKFWCWKPDHGDEANAEELREPDAKRAALSFAADRFHYDDYPMSQTVRVRDEQGNVDEFEVDPAEVVSEEVGGDL